MFIDEANIRIKAGRGGDGVVAFLREKYRPKGGPAGGNGGRGGDVIMVADKDTSSLWELARQRQFRAENGRPGSGRKRAGKDGRDIVLKVPLGTIVRDEPGGRILFDITSHGDKAVIAKGGKGGLGNHNFATPIDQAPRYAEPGKPGEEKELYLELRLIADIGLVGLPNAGKSMFISVVSAAHPKVAAYPFTTKVPELGVVPVGSFKTLVIADLPGLIEGAHKGIGLGDKFLRHIERTRAIAHMIDICPSESDPVSNYLAVRRELVLYSPKLALRPEIIVLTKADLDPDGKRAAEIIAGLEKLRSAPPEPGIFPPLPEGISCFCLAISAVTRYNIDVLMRNLVELVSRLPAPEME